jgi:hypothetical protein
MTSILGFLGYGSSFACRTWLKINKNIKGKKIENFSLIILIDIYLF